MVLYINCCPRKESRTKRLANAVLQKLGEYEEVNLYEAVLLPIDENRIKERNSLLESGKLDAEEFKLARQFASADEIVIAAPFWDLSFPAKLKLYIENIYITGIVSSYDENGMPKGLCNAERLYYVTTSGGPFDGRYSFDYFRTLCIDYFNIPEVKLIKAEMLDVVGFDPEEIIEKAICDIRVSPL